MSDGPVAVLVELTDKKALEPVSRECLGMAARIAASCGKRISAVVMGSAIGDAADDLGRFDIAEVYSLDHPLLEFYEPELYETAFLHFYKEVRPCGILMGHTLRAIDLAPRIACALETGLVTDCTGFELSGGELLFVKEVYGGNICARLCVCGTPFMATIRPKSEAPAAPSQEKRADIVPVTIEITRAGMAIVVVERVIEKNRGAALQDADIVVAGGRGIGGPEGFRLLGDLAGILEGAVGASRPPCDLGWASPGMQIGQTGEIIAPSLYIAVGISGSMQHIAGIAGAKTVVAVNKDPEAAIFGIADYGVVGDYHEVLQGFTGTVMERGKGRAGREES